jgi:His-Xaa-Ser system protein HxsD
MQNETISTYSDGSIAVRFSLALYKLSVLKKAAYKFTDKASILLEEAEAGHVAVRFSFVEDKSSVHRQKIVHDFCNEVLDQDLRESIAEETEPTRNLILAQAFSKTSLLES